MFFADVHNHILYGVDDGARSEQDMYAMADAAYAAGVRLLCATPHYNPGMFEHTKESEMQAFEKLQAYVSEKYPDMRLEKGNEIFVYSDIPSIVSEHGEGTMGDSDVVLIEFYPDRTARQIETTVMLLSQLGYTALLAHVERYQDVRSKHLATYRELGALISVNAQSITGEFGKTAQKAAMKFVLKGLVDMVTSDAHSKSAYAALPKAYDILSKKLDEEALECLFFDNPEELFY